MSSSTVDKQLAALEVKLAKARAQLSSGGALGMWFHLHMGAYADGWVLLS
jgi:hypothetical protein